MADVDLDRMPPDIRAFVCMAKTRLFMADEGGFFHPSHRSANRFHLTVFPKAQKPRHGENDPFWIIDRSSNPEMPTSSGVGVLGLPTPVVKLATKTSLS